MIRLLTVLTCCLFIVGCNSNYQLSQNNMESSNVEAEQNRIISMTQAIQAGGRAVFKENGDVDYVEMPDGTTVGKVY